MRRHILLNLAKKDLLEVAQNKAAWLPMLILPLIFVILFPLLFGLLPQFSDIDIASITNDPDIQTMFENLPPALQDVFNAYEPNQIGIVFILGYMFAPMFLIFPIAFATIIASESFAGERERKTMEALLFTSATDEELFIGKVIASFVPALIISWGSFLVYLIVVNAVSFPLFGYLWFPLSSWWVLIFWITPALALLGISFTVLISARNRTFMGAYQTSASLVTVVLFLMIGQMTGILYLSVGTGLIIGLVFWLIAGGLSYVAVKGFNRVNLLMEQNK